MKFDFSFPFIQSISFLAKAESSCMLMRNLAFTLAKDFHETHFYKERVLCKKKKNSKTKFLMGTVLPSTSAPPTIKLMISLGGVLIESAY